MEGRGPAPAVCFFRRQASVIMPAFAQEFVRAIGQIAPGERRNCINHSPQVGLTRPQSFLGAFLVVNVSGSADESEDLSLGIAQHDGSIEMPAIDAVPGAESTEFH